MKLFTCAAILVLLFHMPWTYAQNFTCADGTILPMRQFCDGRQDCGASDETMTSSLCPECQDDEISCSLLNSNQTCVIYRDYICNNSVTCQGINHCDVGCSSHYRCHDNTCVERSTLCDGNPCNGCPEDDGWKTGIGFQCVRNGDFCRIPQQLLHDEIQDCDQGEDLCFIIQEDGRSRSVIDQSRCFECLDRSMIVPRQKVCDDVIDCSDLSDECLCEGKVPDICNKVKFRSLQEINMFRYSDVSSCELGQVSCGNGTCINRTSVCDSVADCRDNRDERYSYCRGTQKCDDGSLMDEGGECRCRVNCQNNVGILCDGLGDCPPPGGARASWLKEPGYPGDECVAICSNRTFPCTEPCDGRLGIPQFLFVCEFNMPTPPGYPTGFPLRLRLELDNDRVCDGIVDCLGDQSDEIDCPHRFSCPVGNLVNIPRSQLCDGVVHCDDRSDENNCPERFMCPALDNTRVSISRKFLCDFNVNCDDNSDELNCTEDGRFYCENGHLETVPTLFVQSRQVFDGRGDCSDFSDECPTQSQIRNEDIFSSIYQLIANPFLRTLVWIMGLLALFGNGIVVYGEVKKIIELRRKQGSATMRTNYLLVLNLAVADLLMGIYLIILGIAGVVYDGNFCANKTQWLSSTTCGVMGILVVLSSETSVITMVLLTSSRIYAISQPLKAIRLPSMRHVVVGILIAWLISFIMAFLPLSSSLDYIYTENAVIPNNPFFRNVVVNFDSAKGWAEKLMTFDTEYVGVPDEIFEQIRDARSWSDLQNVLGNTTASKFLQVSSYLGYYSANSVCIPRLFVTRQDKSWQFSIAITIFNFLAFIYVASAYSFIIIRSRRNPIRRSDSSRKKKDVKLIAMQKKIIRLIITDFCCWVPISIMAFINFSGIPVSATAYVVSAIVLLPINSALNPILYSNFVDKLFLKCKKRVPSNSATTNSESKLSKSYTKVTKL